MSKINDLRCDRKDFHRGLIVCITKLIFVRAEEIRNYVDAHADELVEVVSKIIIVD